MWRATVKGVLARKVRLALTALAVVLGVTFVSGTYVLTDTLKHSFGTLFSQYAAGVDLVVRTHAPISGQDTNSRQRLPQGIVDVVRRVPGVEAADGFLQGYAQFVGKDGKSTIQTAGAPTFGISWSGGDQVGPARLAQGKRPVRDGQVAMDVGTAERNGFKVGDRVKVLLEGEAEEFKLVGLFKLGTEGDFGAVSFAAFDPHTAQRGLRRAGGVRRGQRPGRVGQLVGVDEASAGARAQPGRCEVRELRGVDGRRGRGRDRQAGRRAARLAQRGVARLRGRRPARRWLHHLQHVHNPRVATHPGARTAARDGRERTAGHRLGAHRSGRGRRASRRRPGWRSASRSRRCCCGRSQVSGSPCPARISS